MPKSISIDQGTNIDKPMIKNAVVILFFSSFITRLLCAGLLTENWDQPFLDAVKAFNLPRFEEHCTSEKQFQIDATNIRGVLENHRKEWSSLLNPAIKQEQLVTTRQELKDRVLRKSSSKVRLLLKKEYEKLMAVPSSPLRASPRVASSASPEFRRIIDRVYDTKPATLIVSLKDYPNILAKIDNRASEEIFRTYYEAYSKTQRVQAKNKFPFLFLPYEVGFDSKYHGVSNKQSEHAEENIFQAKRADPKFVFSERVPLFSDAEIDNLVLLHLMLAQAQRNPRLRFRMQEMYINMARYTCLVDFDDISLRNVPFAKDGRLAPFDTDSFFAKTGVFSFLTTYYAPILFPLREENNARFKNACDTQPAHLFDSFLQKNAKDVEKIFLLNENVIGSILEFLSTRPEIIGPKEKLATMVYATRHVMSLAHSDPTKKSSSSSSTANNALSPVGRKLERRSQRLSMEVLTAPNPKEAFTLEGSSKEQAIVTIWEKLHHDRNLVSYAIRIDDIIERKLKNPGNRHLFGRRCEDGKEFAMRAAIEISEAFGIDLEDAYQATLMILDEGRHNGAVYGFRKMDMQAITSVKFEYWTGIICF